MTISQLPAAPARSDPPATFISKADAFIAALQQFVTEANATAAALNLASVSDTSSTSNAIGTGAKTFTVTAGKSFQGGMYLIIADTAAPSTNSMFAQVTSYSGTTLVVNVISILGSGTKTAWTISLTSSGGATLSANTYTGLQTFKAGADIASATTVDLTVATGNVVSITGTTPVTAFTMTAGQEMVLIASGALPLTYNATTMNINGGISYTCAAGDRLLVVKDLSNVIRVSVIKQDGTPLSTNSKIQPITASVGFNALTITLNPTTLDFRSATLTSGTVNTRTVAAAISVVVSSGSTLGTVNAQQSRLAVLAIDNAGTVELAVVNIAGGVSLDETGVINTTAEGGAGAADSATVIYSTTARTGVPYRVVGYVESTQATAGTWATAPSTIQGAGGNALTAMSSLGYGQTWQDVKASRASGTTYYNTTGKCIFLNASGSAGTSISITPTINGVSLSTSTPTNGGNSYVFLAIPSGVSYSLTFVGTIQSWVEFR